MTREAAPERTRGQGFSAFTAAGAVVRQAAGVPAGVTGRRCRPAPGKREEYASGVVERAFPVPAPDCSDRRNIVFYTARAITLMGHRLLVRPHVELAPEIVSIRRSSDTVFLYCGLHRSLWETTGLLAPLHLAHLPLPYVAMGDNLIKGRLFQSLSKKIGTFMVRRPANRKEMLESARRLRDDVLSFVAHRLDVLVFPEGTRKNIPLHSRYGDFFPASFDGLLEYERNRDAIVASNAGLRPRETWIVPLNVDYSRVREAAEMVAEEAGHPRTLHVLDSLSMIRGIGDTYLSYGTPIRVADHLDLDRKALASLARRRCLDLIKILPVNVVSRARLEIGNGGPVSPAVLEDAVREVVARLGPYADRFRGFSAGDEPALLVRRARRAGLDFRAMEPDREGLYRLYAAYIGHYLPDAPAPAADPAVSGPAEPAAAG